MHYLQKILSWDYTFGPGPLDLLKFCLHFDYALATHSSSHPEVFLGKGVLKICSKFTGEHSCRSVILIKLQKQFY